MKVPTPAEWDLSALHPSRRAYLEDGYTFEDIAKRIASEAKVRLARFCRYKDTRDKIEAQARQIIIRITVSPVDCDLFFNAPDGLRGRYWQSPEAGDRATRLLIDCLIPMLLAYTDTEEVEGTSLMTSEGIRASLWAPSAKVWVYERNAAGQLDMPIEGCPALFVPRWACNENKKIGDHVGTRWRWSPADRDLQIKGALIDPFGREHVPEAKANRAQQIHCFGFT